METNGQQTPTPPLETGNPEPTYLERLKARRLAVYAAYTGERSKPEHRDASSALVSVLVDVALAAMVAGRTLDEAVAEAKTIAEREFYFAGDILKSQS